MGLGRGAAVTGRRNWRGFEWVLQWRFAYAAAAASSTRGGRGNKHALWVRFRVGAGTRFPVTRVGCGDRVPGGLRQSRYRVSHADLDFEWRGGHRSQWSAGAAPSWLLRGTASEIAFAPRAQCWSRPFTDPLVPVHRRAVRNHTALAAPLTGGGPVLASILFRSNYGRKKYSSFWNLS